MKTPQNLKRPTYRQSFVTAIKSVIEGKFKKETLKSLIRFHSANKIDNYNRGGGEKKK